MKLKSLLPVAMILLTLHLHAQQPGVLDKKTFGIQLMRGGTLDSKESLVFDNGQMDPIQCHQYGFSATAYQAKNEAGMQTFRTVCKSEKEGTMIWQGKVNGDQIEGSVVWSKSGQDPIEYTFKGALDNSGK